MTHGKEIRWLCDMRAQRESVDVLVVPERNIAVRIGHFEKPMSMQVSDLVTGEVSLKRGGDYWGGDLHRDGRRVVAMHTSGRADVWDLASGSRIHSFVAHSSQAYCAAFSPDGTRLATGGNDNMIRIWDVATWTLLLEMRGHESYVKALAFSPDGTRLATASGDSSQCGPCAMRFVLRSWDGCGRWGPRKRWSQGSGRLGPEVTRRGMPRCESSPGCDVAGGCDSSRNTISPQRKLALPASHGPPRGPGSIFCSRSVHVSLRSTQRVWRSGLATPGRGG